jgi:hypothetical protein
VDGLVEERNGIGEGSLAAGEYNEHRSGQASAERGYV